MAVSNHIELVEKIMRVLEALAENKEGISLGDLSAQIGMAKSSVFRILHTLKNLSYAEQAGRNGTYALSLKIVGLARSAAGTSGVLGVARPYLSRLRDQVRESAWLGELWHGEVILIDVAEAPHALHLRYGIGDRCPLHATALGKAIAAWLPASALDRILGRKALLRFTRHTNASVSRLQAELARARRNGFAMNNEETVEGVVMWGAPVFDSAGRVCAAVSVGAPTVRGSHAKRRRTIVESVRRTARELSADLARLGYVAPEDELTGASDGLRRVERCEE